MKRSIPLDAVRRIKDLDLSSRPALDFARDMFLFSFYTRGMSFVDMAYLRKDCLENGTIVYRRRKTGQLLFIRWEECMQRVIDKYRTAGAATPYILPILGHRSEENRVRYKNALYRVNRNLKEVARLACVDFPLTMYCARHSWACIAMNKHIPVSVISEGTLRKQTPIMVYGKYEPLFEDSEDLFVYTRTLENEKLLVVCSFTDQETTFTIPEEFVGAELLISNMENEYGKGTITLRPYEAFVLHKK